MKKYLIASTALMLSAGIAAADVTLSGYGRFGLVYNGGAPAGVEKTNVGGRFRLNIDASTTADNGVTFGGRIRIQNDFGSNSNQARKQGGVVNAANMYAKYGAFRLDVGNVAGAFDSTGLLYGADMGFALGSLYTDRSSIYGMSTYTSSQYGAADNRVGVQATYSAAGFTGRLSHIQKDQVNEVTGADQTDLSLDYATDQFALSAAFASNANHVDDADTYFLGAQYKGGDFNVGLNYLDADVEGKTVWLYGNYTMGATTLKAHVGRHDRDTNLTKTVYGIGADYALGGGAVLAGSIERDTNKDTVAQAGVRFNF